MQLFRKKSAGFTIVEVIVVIVIIAILVAISFAAYEKVQETGHDAKRRADIVSFQDELERYYKNNGVYPSSDLTPSGGPFVVTPEKIPSNITLAQLRSIFPRLPENFGDPMRRNENIFRSPQLQATPTYLYIGSKIFNKNSGSSISGATQQTFNYENGTKQICNFGYSFSATTTPDKDTATSYVLGYYSEAQKKFILLHGHSGVPYTITTAPGSNTSCAYANSVL